MKILVRLLVSTAVIFGVAYFSDGSLLQVDGVAAALYGAVALAIVNTIVRPVVKLFAFPVTIMSLGLFALVINALMLYLVAAVVPGFEVTGFLQAVAASLIISIATAIGYKVTDRD
ncbi:MAG: phage holin family protein [Actinomycetota bacterium]|jgi:putative membrane protein|nr:phage holin family protein [Actinomycetota bacterium]